jgi:hypothetical protein
MISQNPVQNWEHTVHIGRLLCADTIEEATKTFSLFSYHKVCSNSSRWSLAFMTASEQHANSQTIRSTHIVSYDKCKLNLCSNEPKLLKEFHSNSV